MPARAWRSSIWPGSNRRPGAADSVLLLAVNQRAVNGVLYNGDATLQQQAHDLFDALNNAGGIS